jgi:anti-sigma regulatory factor (Ser/Thr protein kinase)
MTHELHQRYPASALTPARARHHITAYLHEQGQPQLIPTATLLVSELVTNSVTHAGGPIEVRASFTGPMLHVAIHDHSPEIPRIRDPDISGRGLNIVNALAAAWGVNPIDGQGKATWFELRHR